MQLTSSPRPDRGSGPFSPTATLPISSGLHQVKGFAFVWPPATELIGGGRERLVSSGEAKLAIIFLFFSYGGGVTITGAEVDPSPFLSIYAFTK